MKKLLSILLLLLGMGTGIQALHLSTPAVKVYQDSTIHPKDLPEKIRKHIINEYNGARIIKAEKKESSGTVNSFKVRISHNGKKIVLQYDGKGNFLAKAPETL